MSTKPKILAKTKRIINLEKRKTPLTHSERAELFEFYVARMVRNQHREAWDKKQKEERLQKRLERERKSQDKYECVYQGIQGMIQSDVQTSVKGRLIGVLIRELKTVHVGWQSVAFLQAGEKAKLKGQSIIQPCLDHIYPTQFNGQFIATHAEVMDGLSREYYDKYVQVMCQVASVLTAENIRLGNRSGPQQADRFLTPEHAYREANVEVDFTPILRLEDVAPEKVLQTYFGDRLEEMYKYNC